MNFTPKEVINFVEENDVKFIRLTFCDIFGNLKNIAIMPSELPRAFKKGISFDASAFTGCMNIKYSDLLLFPDASTLSVLPWRPKTGRVVRFFCNIKKPDGESFEGDARNQLKKTAKRAKEMGYTCDIGTECEFYLFDVDEKGRPTRIPHDSGSYLDIAPLDKCENIRREICLSLEEMGLSPESSRHEYGPGQNEIDFKHSEIVSAADNVIYFKTAVKAIALQNGLYASFMPKPMAEYNGSSMHINMSVRKNGENIFSCNPEKMSEDGKHFIAGIMNRIKEITCMLNQTTNSYERFGEGLAPEYINWSCENRAQLIRIPYAEDERTRIEVRSADPTCNPYISFNLLLSAGLEGIEKKLELQPENTNLGRLPQSFEEACNIGKESDFIKEIIPNETLGMLFRSFDNVIAEYNRADSKDMFEYGYYFQTL
jgi:glutamine synthetase